MIKKNDKIRVLPESTLLANGWHADGKRLRKGDLWLWASQTEREYKVKKVEPDGRIETTEGIMIPCEAVRVIGQTWFEYLQGLTVEELADYFVMAIPDENGEYREYYSGVTGETYYDEQKAVDETAQKLKEIRK